MRKIRLLSIILTLCICLSLAIPAAYAAESTSYLEVSYAQASSLEVGQPITIPVLQTIMHIPVMILPLYLLLMRQTAHGSLPSAPLVRMLSKLPLVLVM